MAIKFTPKAPKIAKPAIPKPKIPKPKAPAIAKPGKPGKMPKGKV